MVKFDIEKFCDLQGHFDDLSSSLQNRIFVGIFGTTGIIIIVFNVFVLFKGVVSSRTLRRKRNVLVLSLIISDLCFGLIFIPLFVIELLKGDQSNYPISSICDIRSWRVIVFTYLFSTRLLSILFISVNTYIKTCKAKTKLEFWFDRCVGYISTIVVWLITMAFLLLVAGSDIEAWKTLGTLTYAYFFVSITLTLVSYMLAYSAIKRAKSRSRSSWYDEAIDFVQGILIWFLITTIPIAVFGLVLLVLAHDHTLKSSHQALEHQVYLAALLISTIDAIANPIVYLRKFKEFQQFRTTIRRNNRSPVMKSTTTLRVNADKTDYPDDEEKQQRDNTTYDYSTFNVNHDIECWNDGAFDDEKPNNTNLEECRLTKYKVTYER